MIAEKIVTFLGKQNETKEMEILNLEQLENEIEIQKKALKEIENKKIKESKEKIKKHILVIDDDPRMLRLIKEELRDEYNVATATSGKVGLAFLQRKTTDLILLDYEMPEENGPEVLDKIRADIKTKNIPVVFLTGINDREKIQKVLSMKPQGYLLKPINHDKLLETISNVIG